MLVFGVDVPLLEVILILTIILFLLLIESIVVIFLMVKQMNKSRKLTELVEKMSEVILEIKKAEIEELDRLKK